MFVAELKRKKSSGEWTNELYYISTMEYIVPYNIRNKFQNMYIEFKKQVTEGYVEHDFIYSLKICKTICCLWIYSYVVRI